MVSGIRPAAIRSDQLGRDLFESRCLFEIFRIEMALVFFHELFEPFDCFIRLTVPVCVMGAAFSNMYHSRRGQMNRLEFVFRASLTNILKREIPVVVIVSAKCLKIVEKSDY